MNNKAQVRGFALLLVVFIICLTLFGLIEIFKEVLNNIRGGNSNNGLNCPDTITFDSTDYNNDTALEKLVRRPTCFVTGLSMNYFIWSVLITAFIWLAGNWRKK